MLYNRLLLAVKPHTCRCFEDLRTRAVASAREGNLSRAEAARQFRLSERTLYARLRQEQNKGTHHVYVDVIPPAVTFASDAPDGAEEAAHAADPG